MMKSEIQVPKRSIHWRFALSLVVVAIYCQDVGHGEPVPIRDISLHASGEVRVRVPVRSESYYTLFRSIDLRGDEEPVSMELGSSLAGAMAFSNTDFPKQAFFSVRAHSVASPLDQDGDFIDDVWELNYSERLDPLHPLDAFADPDRDGSSHLQDYLQQTGREPGIIGGFFDEPERDRALCFDGSTAYILSDIYAPDLTILDLADPTSPLVLGEITEGTGGVHTPFAALEGPNAVIAHGDHLLVASDHYTQGGSLTIIDVSDPTSPKLAAELRDDEEDPHSLTKLNGANSIFAVGTIAYVTADDHSGSALTILDIADPANPRWLSELVDDSTDSSSPFTKLQGANSVFVSHNMAFVTADGYPDALTIIDVSDPANPTLLSEIVDQSWDSASAFGGIDGIHDVSVEDGVAYVVADNYSGAALSMIDVSDPTNPQLLREIKDDSVDPASPFTLLGEPISIVVEDSVAYVVSGGYSDSGLTIIDVSDPTNPSLLAEISDVSDDPGSAFSMLRRANSLVVEEGIAYVTTDYYPAGVTVIDATDPTEPKLVVEIEADYGTASYRFSDANSVCVRGDIVFVASKYDDAVTAIDLRDSAEPEVISHMVDSSDAPFTLLSGASSIHVRDGTAYVTADYDDALSIIDVSDPGVPRLLAEVVDDSVLAQSPFKKMNSPAFVCVDGSVAFVAGSDFRSGGYLTLIDVSDPGEPRLLSEIVDDDYDPFSPFSRLYGASAVAVEAGVAYVTSKSDGALTVIDVSSPENIQFLAELSNDNGYDHLRGACSVVVSASGVACVAAEYSDAVSIIDVSDPGDPVLLAELLDDSRDLSSPFSKLRAPRTLDLKGAYLYVAAEDDNAVTIVDISNPSAPRLVAELEDDFKNPGSPFARLNGVSHVAVSGDLALIAARDDNAVTVVDIGDPTNPLVLNDELVSSKANPSPFTKLRWADSLAVSGSAAFIASSSDDALTIADISDPSQPMVLAEIVDEFEEFSRLEGATDVAVRNGVAIVAAEYDDALSILDVSDPRDPRLLSEVVDVRRDRSSPFTRLHSPQKVIVNGTTAYVLAGYRWSDSAITIIDIDDPSHPELRSEIVDQSVDPDSSFTRLDGILSIVADASVVYAVGTRGLTLIDVTRPGTPQLIAETDLSGRIRNATAIAVQNGCAYVGTYRGFWVVDLAERSNPVAVREVRWSSFGAPRLIANPSTIFAKGPHLFVGSDSSFGGGLPFLAFRIPPIPSSNLRRRSGICIRSLSMDRWLTRCNAVGSSSSISS